MNVLPLARNSELVVQELKGELLIYNVNNHQAFCLNETVMLVFNACDGKTTLAELKRRTNFTDDLIYLALDKLRDENLIEDYRSKFDGVSRREVMKKVGLACAVALPVISSLVAPAAAAAASNTCLGAGGSFVIHGHNLNVCFNSFLQQSRCCSHAVNYGYVSDPTNSTCVCV